MILFFCIDTKIGAQLVIGSRVDIIFLLLLSVVEWLVVVVVIVGRSHNNRWQIIKWWQ